MGKRYRLKTHYLIHGATLQHLPGDAVYEGEMLHEQLQPSPARIRLYGTPTPDGYHDTPGHFVDEVQEGE